MVFGATPCVINMALSHCEGESLSPSKAVPHNAVTSPIGANHTMDEPTMKVERKIIHKKCKACASILHIGK